MEARRERILITGASGFLGAYLAHDLVAAGHDVHLLLRLDSDLRRLRGLAGRYTPWRADLRDADAVRACVRECRPEIVYHLAACGAFQSQQDRGAIVGSNLIGTANLLDALDGVDYRAFVHAGTSSEYGHKPGPMREDDRPEPRTAYGVSKAAATLLCAAEAFKGRPVCTVRVFSAYGPYEDPTRIAAYVMGCCLRGEPARVSAGRQPRDWVYVADVAELLRLAAHHPAARGRILHAGTGRRQTVRDLIETVLAVCGGGRAEYGQAPERADEPTSWVADIRTTSALTGWVPRHDLRSGVEEYWAWYTSGGNALAA